MDAETLAIAVSIIGILVNVLMAYLGYARVILRYEVVQTPILALLAVWPLYLTGHLSADWSIAVITAMCLPMFVSLYGIWKFWGIPLDIAIWAAVCSVICFNDLSAFFLSTVIPGVSGFISIVLTVAIVMAAIYAFMFAFMFAAAYIGGLINNRRRRYH